MEPSCVRQTYIPGTSKLYSDYLYDFARVSRFYPHHFSDVDSLADSARALQFPESRRSQIVSALRPLNPSSGSLDKLAEPGTVAVVTGQQVGLLSGPVYTVFKALTAVRLSDELCRRGIPAVPVFWLATEDHDLAEVDHAWLYNQHASPLRIAAKTRGLENIPVGNVPFDGLSMSAAVSEALGDLPFAAEVLDRVREYYGSPTTFGRAFHGLLQSILASFDLIFLDPLDPAVRAVAAPLLAEMAQRVPELTAGIRQRNTELETAGYHAQVHVDATASLLFRLENGRRAPLRWRDGAFIAKERSFSPAELAADPEQISPNALLRPVVQDYLLPTVSYIAGPAEIAYFAQSQVLYDKLLGRMPLIYPRNSFTLLDARAVKLLDRYQLRVEDLFDSQDRARAKVAAKLVPQDLRGDISALRSGFASSLADLQAKLLRFDPTLSASAAKSTAKITYQLDKLQAKTARETIRRDAHAAANADFLLNLIYPQRHLQERFYSVVPMLAEHGLDLPRRLYDFVQLTCPDHMVRTL